MDVTIAAQLVLKMNRQLREELLWQGGILQKKKLFEHTLAKHQMDTRCCGGSIDLSDHVRGIVYAMLTNGKAWHLVIDSLDCSTGRIAAIEAIFQNFDPEKFDAYEPEKLRDSIKQINCASQSTLKQMKALVEVNIPKLKQLQDEYDSVDTFYQKLVDIDPTFKTLVTTLSCDNSEYKLSQMSHALVAEYLKNVGYDIAKPDRHLMRLFGREYWGVSAYAEAKVYEVIDFVAAIAKELSVSAAEVDYILWSYCADGFGEICKKRTPKCEACVAKSECKHITQKG